VFVEEMYILFATSSNAASTRKSPFLEGKVMLTVIEVMLFCDAV
jgi:hypothetical protein